MSARVAETKVRVGHSITMRGQEIRAPVFQLDIDAQETRITPELLRLFQSIPAERMALASQTKGAPRRSEEQNEEDRPRSAPDKSAAFL